MITIKPIYSEFPKNKSAVEPYTTTTMISTTTTTTLIVVLLRKRFVKLRPPLRYIHDKVFGMALKSWVHPTYNIVRLIRLNTMKTVI